MGEFAPLNPKRPPSDYDRAPDPPEPSWPDTRKIDDTWGFEEDSRAGAYDSAVSGPPSPAPLPSSDSGPSREPSDAANLPRGLRERYRLIHILGKGGFATVYLAYDSVLDQEVAIKVLRLDPSTGSAGDRFLREARIGVKLRHPNIVTIYDIIQTDDGLQLLMEYLPGGSLTQRIRAHGPLEPRAAIHVTRQVALALAYAHNHGVVHRDVKPSNILLARGGVVKLGDFGTAAHVDQHDFTQTGMVVGTPLYMAPEQSTDSREADARADIYSLALTLYHMLTGKAPRILDLEEVAEPFRDLMRCAAALDRDERPDSAEDFIALLDRIDDEYVRHFPATEERAEQPAPRPAPVAPPPRQEAWPRPHPRRPWWIPSGGMLAVLIVILAALAGMNKFKLYRYLGHFITKAVPEAPAGPPVPIETAAPTPAPAALESPAPIPTPVGPATPSAATPTPPPSATATPVGRVTVESTNNLAPAVPLAPPATPGPAEIQGLEQAFNKKFRGYQFRTVADALRTLRDPNHLGLAEDAFRSLMEDAKLSLQTALLESPGDPLLPLALSVICTRAGNANQAADAAAKALDLDQRAGGTYKLTAEKIQRMAESPNLGAF